MLVIYLTCRGRRSQRVGILNTASWPDWRISRLRRDAANSTRLTWSLSPPTRRDSPRAAHTLSCFVHVSSGETTQDVFDTEPLRVGMGRLQDSLALSRNSDNLVTSIAFRAASAPSRDVSLSRVRDNPSTRLRRYFWVVYTAQGARFHPVSPGAQLALRKGESAEFRCNRQSAETGKASG